MKRLFLFCGSNHYPKGGWDDFVGSADNSWDLKPIVDMLPPNDGSRLWAHIVRASDGCILEEYDGRRKCWKPYEPPHVED